MIDRSTTVQQILAPTVRIDWSQFEGMAALRCTVGVAIPLVIGLVLRQPSVSAFGAVGAVSVGFGSFQGAYRSRAALMISAAAGMAISIFIGSLAGRSSVPAVIVASGAAFLSGMMIALGPAAAFVALQSCVAVLVAGGFPLNVPDAARAAAIVFGGGVIQTLLVVTIWPLRRFTVERHTIATAYRTLGSYAINLPAVHDVAPEPHTFAALAPPLRDPQPFARPSDLLVFQALFDEAERIRASLAAIVSWQRRTAPDDPSCRASLPQACGRALLEIAGALHEGRTPRDERGEIWRTIDACVAALPKSVEIDALLGQIRAAWRTAGMLTSKTADHLVAPRLAPLARPPVSDAITTLRANLSLESTACRHALRLAVAVGVAAATYRALQLPRGYWMPMTALLVLRPDFHETFARGAARMAGTILGGGVATLIVRELHPGATALTVLLLAFVWCCYATFRVNYTLFTIAVTGYVVFILMLSGVGEMTAVRLRAIDTVAGGCIALIIYAAWPTWAAATVRSALASMFEAQSVYVHTLLNAYADPRTADVADLVQMRAAARLARSNAEALVERMLAEPQRQATIRPRAATGLLAAIRRNALATLTLHAGVERGVDTPSPNLAGLAADMKLSLTLLAEAAREGRAPRPLPPLRQTQLAISESVNPLVKQETDLMVDAINTMADLLTRDAAAY
ncbi:MAG: FUSC family protein [Vicinamibacterales bacterium]